jgi:hypothetical protein
MAMDDGRGVLVMNFVLHFWYWKIFVVKSVNIVGLELCPWDW